MSNLELMQESYLSIPKSIRRPERYDLCEVVETGEGLWEHTQITGKIMTQFKQVGLAFTSNLPKNRKQIIHQTFTFPY